jgi:hypothetical protein
MDRNRPAIERRLPVDLPSVERVAQRGKRLLAARLLLDAGADIDGVDNASLSALIMAAETGNVRVVKALLAASARTQARHHNGSTAMDFARAGNHQEVIRMLSGQAGSQPSRSPGSSTVIGTSAPIDRRTSPVQKGERQ